MINNYSKIVDQYATVNNLGTAYLAFRDIDKIIKKYIRGSNALDFGCGNGDSTELLLDNGLNVSATDISRAMISKASIRFPQCDFKIIKDKKTPYKTKQFDLVFSSFVLLEIATKNEMVNIFNEIYRVLKYNGVFIFITCTENFYTGKWLSIDVDYPQNKCLVSGDKAKLRFTNNDLSLYDFYWTSNDYIDVIQKAMFEVKDIIYPLGLDTDGYKWVDEKKSPPYVIYVLSK